MTFNEFKSNLINGFLTAIKPNGFNCLKPKTFISKLYNVVSGLNFICCFNVSPESPSASSKIKNDIKTSPCCLFDLGKNSLCHFGFISSNLFIE